MKKCMVLIILGITAHMGKASENFEGKSLAGDSNSMEGVQKHIVDVALGFSTGKKDKETTKKRIQDVMTKYDGIINYQSKPGGTEIRTVLSQAVNERFSLATIQLLIDCKADPKVYSNVEPLCSLAQEPIDTYKVDVAALLLSHNVSNTCDKPHCKEAIGQLKQLVKEKDEQKSSGTDK